MSQLGATLLVVAALALLSTGSAQSQQGQRLYKWKDHNGVVHYGDKIPPEYANLDRNVLNDQGVIRRLRGRRGHAEDRAESGATRSEAEAERQAKAEIARRDRMLLETYLTVADIEDLRDRRLELLESQIKVTELYLGNLRKRLVGLQDRGQQRSSRTRHAPMRRRFPRIWRSTSRARRHRSRSTSRRWRGRAQIRQRCESSFDGDIARFRELKGG